MKHKHRWIKTKICPKCGESYKTFHKCKNVNVGGKPFLKPVSETPKENNKVHLEGVTIPGSEQVKINLEPTISETKPKTEEQRQIEQIKERKIPSELVSAEALMDFYELPYDIISGIGRKMGAEYPSWKDIPEEKRLRIGNAMYRIEKSHPELFKDWMLDLIDGAIIIGPMVAPLMMLIAVKGLKKKEKKTEKTKEKEEIKEGEKA